MSVFVLCLTFSLAALGRIDDGHVPQLVVLVGVELHEARAEPLRGELALPASAVERLYPAAGHRRRAGIAGVQGIGGAPG